MMTLEDYTASVVQNNEEPLKLLEAVTAAASASSITLHIYSCATSPYCF